MEYPDWSTTYAVISYPGQHKKYIITFKIKPFKQTDATDRTLELSMDSGTTKHFIGTVNIVMYYVADRYSDFYF